MLSKSVKAVLAVAMVAAILLLVGCSTQASIADINKDPGHYAGKDVTIHGTVSEVFSALGNGIFHRTPVGLQPKFRRARQWKQNRGYGPRATGLCLWRAQFWRDFAADGCQPLVCK